MNNKELKLQTVFDNSPDGILIAKMNGSIDYANAEVGRIFGFELSDIVGQDIQKILSLEKNKTVDPVKFSGFSEELQGKKKSGVIFSFLLSRREMKVGEESFYAYYIHELSHQKKKEELLSQYTSELERSNQELKEFAYVSSHDLQEPLRKIHAFGEILIQQESKFLSKEGRDYLERIVKATLRMQNLISDLLSFSRISTPSVSFEPVDLNNIFKEVLSDLEVTIESTHAVINCDSLPVLEAEPTQIRQVFQNIISNAIKFRKENVAPVIHIHCTKSKDSYSGTAENHEFVEIYFEDNGIGFDEKHLDKIFKIFQRLEDRKYEGSGIGLAICRKIITYHGGQITARSKPGKGSVFIINLPIKTIQK